MEMESIAIITARGGSKRIPKKNIRDFNGKPIIAYSIEAALESGIFDEVMVSTDSEEIAEIANRYGAKVPFLRSDETSSDSATTADVLSEVLDEYEKTGKKFRYMCCIYPTAPFVTDEKLKKAYEMIKQEHINQVMPVVAFSFPPQRGHMIKDGKLYMLNPECKNVQSQILEKVYHDCGQFYFMDIEAFKNSGGDINENIYPMIMSELEVQDIDNETDWRIAEIKYRIINEKNENNN